MSNSSRICVAVRKRPLPEGAEKDIVETLNPSIIVNEPKVKYDLTPYTDRHTFTFDHAFGEACDNHRLYKQCCLPLIETVFSHGNATCFAYGQTGSGKTHTMLGSTKEPGLYAIAAGEIFSRASHLHAEIFVSFYEIYGRKIFDLLNNHERLFAREDADKVINICGLSEHPVRSTQQIFDVIKSGSAYRAAGQTSANSESSRSHAVLQIEVRESAAAGGRRGPKTIGKISFIDLAGNERGADTFDCDRKTRMEGAEINKSLLALKECIRALGMGKSHVPFRGSILTEVLRDSFTGNSRTTMIATISPTAQHCVNTLNTLRYTQRVKDLGGNNSGAKVEQVPAVSNARRLKRRPFEASPPSRNRPEWITDFSGGTPDSDANLTNENETPQSSAAPSAALKSSPRQRQLSVKPREEPPKSRYSAMEIKVKDPKIATIVQQHIVALEETDDEDDDDGEGSGVAEGGLRAENKEPNAGGHAGMRKGPLHKEEERQVRKVHAYVMQEIGKAEEKLVALHRRHIDSKMTGIKEEIRAIQCFDESDSVDEYVGKVRGLLQRQQSDIEQLLAMLSAISDMLRDEEDLSKSLNSSSKRAGAITATSQKGQ